MGPPPDRLIELAATGAQILTQAELRRVLEQVAAAGFDPDARERVRGELAGLEWQGRVLQGSDRIPPVERHYLKHVVKELEWPRGTSLPGFLESLKLVVLDAGNGVFTSRYQETWQLGVIRRSQDLRGFNGQDWVLLEYRIATGHWVTAYQPEAGLLDLASPRRSNLRWLRGPTQSSV